jgi:hypothetical protein
VGDAEVFFFAEGAEPVPWRIDAEPSTRGSARTKVYVDGELVADMTVHASCGADLPTEVQTVAAALVWSRIRAIARDRGEPLASDPGIAALTAERNALRAVLRDFADSAECDFARDGKAVVLVDTAAWRRLLVAAEEG